MVKSAILNRKSQGLVCFALMLIGGVYQLFGSISWLVCTMQTEFAVNVITHVYGHRKIRYWSDILIK